MSNYFNLELDTTPPDLEIYHIDYTVKGNDLRVTIESNENLDNYQDIYIVDSSGTKFDLIFDFVDDKEMHGLIDFSNFSTGIATLYVRLRDEVKNVSSLYKSTINVILGREVETIIDSFSRALEIIKRNRLIESDFEVRDLDLSVLDRKVDSKGETRRIENIKL